jgi:hypothetical protein
VKASALGFKRVLVRYDVFGYEFECIIGPKKNVGKYVAHHLKEPYWDNPEKQHGMTYVKTGLAPIVWFPRFPRTSAEHGTLAHEVSHAVMEMLRHVGVPINVEAGEAFCYALGYGVRKILEAQRGR